MIASFVVSAAITAKAQHDAERAMLDNLNPEDRAAYIERKEKREAMDLRRREVAALEKQSNEKGYGAGALLLAFIFGSSL